MTTDPGKGDSRELGCLIASGDEAGAFLQAQLSSDLSGLEAGQLCLTGWHNPQGRVRCLLWAGPLESGNWRLITEASQITSLISHLGRYIMRAKVSLSPEPDAQVAIATHQGTVSDSQVSRWPLPGGGAQTLVAGSQQAVEALAAETASQAVGNMLVAGGVPRVQVTLSDQLLGPSLNLDLLAGISFSKGCFPGQEVLARLHNLGRVKRRLLKFAYGGSPPQVGIGINNRDGDQRGQVISVGSNGELLASLELRAQGDALFATGSPIPLRELPLPYVIPELNQSENST